MTFTLACGDVMPGCAARFESRSRADLMQQIATHARADHGITDITPDILSSIESRVAVS